MVQCQNSEVSAAGLCQNPSARGFRQRFLPIPPPKRQSLSFLRVIMAQNGKFWQISGGFDSACAKTQNLRIEGSATAFCQNLRVGVSTYGIMTWLCQNLYAIRNVRHKMRSNTENDRFLARFRPKWHAFGTFWTVSDDRCRGFRQCHFCQNLITGGFDIWHYGIAVSKPACDS